MFNNCTTKSTQKQTIFETLDSSIDSVDPDGDLSITIKDNLKKLLKIKVKDTEF